MAPTWVPDKYVPAPKPPKGPRGPSGVSRPDLQVVQVVIGRPMCPHYCKACQGEK